MFVKTGDGKITHIIKSEDDLTEEQKKSVKKLSEKNKDLKVISIEETK